MQINRLSVSKGRTLGVEIQGKVRYQKVSISLSAKLDDKDDPFIEYNKLSAFIEEKLQEEVNIIKQSYVQKN